MTPLVQKIAAALCAERCAFLGEPPCWRLAATEGFEWPPDGCDEPGCKALAAAVAAALGASALQAEITAAVWPKPSALSDAIGTEILWHQHEARLHRSAAADLRGEDIGSVEDEEAALHRYDAKRHDEHAARLQAILSARPARPADDEAEF